MPQQLSRRTFIKALGTGAGVTPLILCGLTSASAKPVDTTNRKHVKGVKMGLTDDEIAVLNGRDGPTMAKVMRSVVAYGDAFDAPFLLDVQTPGHWVTGMGQKGLDALYDLADKLIEGGVKAKLPFTIDPYPMDYENIEYTEAEKKENADLYCFQKRWDEQVIKLGLRDGSRKSYSCTCYLPEVGNRPEYGEVLAWAESSAVVYANSVLGARCNRNSGPIEMLCSMCGKTPFFGFLTDEARQAVWHIDIKTESLPNAMLLGSAVGMKVGSAVPYITGLDKFLGTTITPAGGQEARTQAHCQKCADLHHRRKGACGNQEGLSRAVEGSFGASALRLHRLPAQHSQSVEPVGRAHRRRPQGRRQGQGGDSRHHLCLPARH